MTDQLPPPTTFAGYEQDANDALTSLLATLDSLDAEQMVVPADQAGWNVRDHVAHLVAYEEVQRGVLQREQAWVMLDMNEEEWREKSLDEINEVIRAMTVNIAPGEVVSMLKDTHAQLLEDVGKLSAEELTQPILEYFPDWAWKRPWEGTVLQRVWMGSARHINAHHEYIRIIAGVRA